MICISRQKCYTPQLEREPVSILHHEAKARQIHTTALASSLIKAALRYEGVLGYASRKRARQKKHPNRPRASHRLQVLEVPSLSLGRK